MSEQREGQCVCEGDSRKELWSTWGTSPRRPQTEPVGRVSGSWIGWILGFVLFVFCFCFSGEVQLNSGHGCKKWELLKIPWEAKQWQIEFLGVVLGTDFSHSKKGGVCLVSGGGSSFFQKTPGPPPGLRVRGVSQGPSAFPGCVGRAGLFGRALQRKLLCASAISSKRL